MSVNQVIYKFVVERDFTLVPQIDFGWSFRGNLWGLKKFPVDYIGKDVKSNHLLFVNS